MKCKRTATSLIATVSACHAFVSSKTSTRTPLVPVRVPGPWTSNSFVTPRLKSSIEGNDDSNEESSSQIIKWVEDLKEQLPKAPEDSMALSGDIGALFLYSYFDHFANHAYSKYIVLSHEAAVKEYGPNSVWLDHNALPAVLEPLHWSDLPCYSTALTHAGICSVLMVTTWLISGYINGAFLFENTVMCDARRSLVVTGRSWVMSCALMIGFAMIYNTVCGCPSSHSIALSLTRTDADFIFDSLSVLVTWRFVINSIFSRF